MSGNVNVKEWCQDYHDKDYPGYSPTDNPQGPERPSIHRVAREGSWSDLDRHVCVANRDYARPDATSNTRGFRLAMNPN